MIDLYYTLEGPLKADVPFLCHRLRLDLKKHGKTLESLLVEFFHLNEEGTYWHHTRCDREIDAYIESADDREQKQAHEAERMRRYRERRKQMFDALRSHGVIPKWDINMDELQRLFNATCNAPATRTGAEQVTNGHVSATGTDTAIQNQNQNHIARDASRSRKKPASTVPVEFDVTDEMAQWAVAQGVVAERVLPETEKFLDHFRATGKAHSDWLATWRNWMRRSVEMKSFERR